jgi:hypothetical protein
VPSSPATPIILEGCTKPLDSVHQGHRETPRKGAANRVSQPPQPPSERQGAANLLHQEQGAHPPPQTREAGIGVSLCPKPPSNSPLKIERGRRRETAIMQWLPVSHPSHRSLPAGTNPLTRFGHSATRVDARQSWGTELIILFGGVVHSGLGQTATAASPTDQFAACGELIMHA